MRPTEFLNDWTPKDRSLAIGLIVHEGDIHGPCGQPASESMDPDGPDYSVEDIQCRACKVLADAGGKDDDPGTIWYVTKR